MNVDALRNTLHKIRSGKLDNPRRTALYIRVVLM
jgi:hypothetical protein